MPSFRETIEIDADADATWRVLGDLASVQRWIPGIVKVELTEGGRACTFDDGRVQHERISDYSPERRFYSYSIEGGLPVRDNRGSFAVDACGGGSMVVWESSFEPLEPTSAEELIGMWEGALPMVLVNLKRVVEESAS